MVKAFPHIAGFGIAGKRTAQQGGVLLSCWRVRLAVDEEALVLIFSIVFLGMGRGRDSADFSGSGCCILGIL